MNGKKSSIPYGSHDANHHHCARLSSWEVRFSVCAMKFSTEYMHSEFIIYEFETLCKHFLNTLLSSLDLEIRNQGLQLIFLNIIVNKSQWNAS